MNRKDEIIGKKREEEGRKGKKRGKFFLPFSSFFLLFLPFSSFFFPLRLSYAAVLDTFVEDFDSRTADATIDSVEKWSVTAGSTSNAVVQSSITSNGTGKALKITGASTPVTAARSTTYGSLTPTWVRCLVHAGLGNDRRSNPSSGIAAVSFDYTGRILAADSTSWVDTGKTFTEDSWWVVTYKLNFTNHTYDLFLSPLGTQGISFIPVKEGLNFIDATKSSLSKLEFQGSYSTTLSDDTYLDDVSVTYIEGVHFVSPAQTLVRDQLSGSITVQLQNSLGEPQHAARDIYLELKSTSTGGKFSLQREPWTDISQILLLKNATSVSFYYKDGKTGQPILAVKEFPDTGWLEGLQQQKVISQSAHFEVLATSPQTAGAPFAVTILARDEEGVIDETYGGTVTLKVAYVSPASGTLQISPAETGGFAKGKLETNLMYPDAGYIQITVTDKQDESKTGSSGQILVLPAGLSVQAERRQVVGRAFPLTVTALSASGGVTPNYQGSVNFGTAPGTGGALSPAALSAGSFQQGKASVQASYSRWGTVTLSATDASSAAVTGQSDPIVFYPDSIQLTVGPPPAPRDFYYTDELFKVEVRALAADGSPIPNYHGTFSLEGASQFRLPDTYAFVEADAGVHVFQTSIASAGTYPLQVKEAAAGLSSASLSATVKQALLKVVPTVGPVGGATEVTILLVDDGGRVITSESSATLTVKLVEDNPNQSVSSSALAQSITIVQGKATFLVANTESENVTVIPVASFGAKSQAGTVSFGRFAKKGVGLLLWREVEARGR